MAFPRNGSNIIHPTGTYDTTALVNRRISRRRALQIAGATAGALTMPYFFMRRSGAQAAKLQFWNFYCPGGTVKTQIRLVRGDGEELERPE